MDISETEQQSQAKVQQFTVGKFVEQQDVERAAKLLIEAGFSTKKIQINAPTLQPKLSLAESNAIDGAKGGAIVGATFGAILGLSTNIILRSVPDLNITINLPPFLKRNQLGKVN